MAFNTEVQICATFFFFSEKKKKKTTATQAENKSKRATSLLWSGFEVKV